jgi:alkyl hydroperoxide reductase subunit F
MVARLLDEHASKSAKDSLAGLARPVRLVLFTERPAACATCRDQRQLLEEVAALSERVSLEVKDLVADGEDARALGVVRVPTTVVMADRDVGVRFLGVTAGYEFESLLEAISIVAEGRAGLDPEVSQLLEPITEPVHLQVMVTVTCPYCARMVQLAHRLAVANEHVTADMVESAEFPELVQRYGVSNVPQTVVNERPGFVGALPPLSATLEILKVVHPAAYEQAGATLREARGERRVRDPRADHRYDVAIIGAGPAAMAATIYAARKALDVVVVGDQIGGQITDTAVIENWLGNPVVAGTDLAEAFRDHVERHQVAERLHTTVSRIARLDHGFGIETSDGVEYEATTVIYCTGKRYRRLGVPGESRFLGRGIAFCATCDAPLYRDKAVAIIGGGNSAFSAARDLLPFAAAIHLVNILFDWQADPVLFDEVRSDKRTVLHPATEVTEYLGRDHLEGVRLKSRDGHERVDLGVQGVFLEIGLVPNSGLVVGLVDLNVDGEVVVGRDQSTSLAGLFAAGDVTDESEKQIVVAAGAGAKAALAAHRYLRGLSARAEMTASARATVGDGRGNPMA